MSTLKLGICLVTVDLESAYQGIYTSFPDGKRVYLIRNYLKAEDYQEYAQSWGMTDPPLALLQHDFLHTWVMTQLGLDYSLVLAHESNYCASNYADRVTEEQLVGTFQGLVNSGLLTDYYLLPNEQPESAFMRYLTALRSEERRLSEIDLVQKLVEVRSLMTNLGLYDDTTAT